jgi:hypothetical protein
VGNEATAAISALFLASEMAAEELKRWPFLSGLAFRRLIKFSLFL